MDAATTLAAEIRRLFRQAPLDEYKFARHAPNTALTLHPTDSNEALLRFYDLFDDLSGDNKVEAASAMIGLTNRSGNVLNRMTDFATDKNPRTVRRWAYDGIDTLVRHMMEKYEARHAGLELYLTGRRDATEVALRWGASVQMNPVSVAWNLTWLDRSGSESDEHTIGAAEGEYAFEVPKMADLALVELIVGWSGEVVPVMFAYTDELTPLQLAVEQWPGQLTLRAEPIRDLGLLSLF